MHLKKISTFLYIAVFLLFLIACNARRPEIETPKEYFNHVTAEAAVYSRDSVTIISDLYSMMKKHTESFSNPEYFDSTILFIDSLLYDSTLNKIAVFVVAKNPTYRNPHSRSPLPYYYNANCYLGKRIKNDSSAFELVCLCRFYEINSDDYVTAVKALKEDFFGALATVQDEKGQPVFKYNLDDRRFWDSPTGWERVFK